MPSDGGAPAYGRASTDTRLAAGDSAFYAMWGGANLLAYAAIFLAFGASGPPGDLMRGWSPSAVWWVFAGVLTAGGAASMAHLLRSARHAGPWAGARRMYVAAWALSFLLAVPVLGVIYRLAPGEQAGMVTLSVLAHVTGVANMLGAGVWRDGLQFAYGVAISLSIPLALAAGPEFYALVYAMTIGVGGLLAAVLSVSLRRRTDAG